MGFKRLLPVKRPSLINDDTNGTILTEQHLTDFEKLCALQDFVHNLSEESSRLRATSERSSSKELRSIIDEVTLILQQHLPVVVDDSLKVAQKGLVLTMDAMDLAKAIEREAPEGELRRFFEVTTKMAANAIADTNRMVSNFRTMRQKLFQAIHSIDTKANKERSLMKKIRNDLFGLGSSLRDVQGHLLKQEQFATLLTSWWMTVEGRLRYMQQSASVSNLRDMLQRQLICERWTTLGVYYNRYITSVIQLQHQNPILRIHNESPGALEGDQDIMPRAVFQMHTEG